MLCYEYLVIQHSHLFMFMNLIKLYLPYMCYEICGHVTIKEKNHLAELNFFKIILYLMGYHYGYFVRGTRSENLDFSE